MSVFKNSIMILFLFIGVNCMAQVDTISTSQRALIAVVNLTANEKPSSLLKQFHSIEEQNAFRIINSKMGDMYKETIVLYQRDTTEENILSAVQQLAAEQEILAIDMIFYTHGHSVNSLAGAPTIGLYREDHVFIKSADLAPKVRTVANGKLRMLYSDACWSSQQNKDWLMAGFVAVAGTEKVDANQTLDLNRFLKKWRNGSSFGLAIKYANKGIATDFMDWLLKGNSTKIPQGDLSVNINTGYQKLVLEYQSEVSLDSPAP